MWLYVCYKCAISGYKCVISYYKFVIGGYKCVIIMLIIVS